MECRFGAVALCFALSFGRLAAACPIDGFTPTGEFPAFTAPVRLNTNSGTHYATGLLVRLQSGRDVLVVGPYATGGHRALREYVKRVHGQEPQAFLWGGEMKIIDGKIHAFNDTSGLLAEGLEKEGLGIRVVPNGEGEQNTYLRTFLRTHHRHLLADKVTESRFGEPDAKPHLWPGVDTNFRHDVGNIVNVFSTNAGIAQLVKPGGSAEGSRDSLIPGVMRMLVKRLPVATQLVQLLRADGVIDPVRLARAERLLGRLEKWENEPPADRPQLVIDLNAELVALQKQMLDALPAPENHIQGFPSPFTPPG